MAGTPRRAPAWLLAVVAAVPILVTLAPYGRPLQAHLGNAVAGHATPDARRYLAAVLADARGDRDALVSYQVALYPPVVRAVVRGVAGTSPAWARGLGHVLFLLVVAGGALTAGAIAGAGAAWGAALLLLACGGRLLVEHTGAAPWTFALPALGVFAASFATGRLRLALAGLALLAAASPVLALPAALALAAVAWRARPRRVALLAGALALALGGAILVVVDLVPWGAPIAAEAPEVGPRGPQGGLARTPLDREVAAQLESFAPWGPPIWGPLSRPVAGWMVVALVIGGLLAAGREAAGRRVLLLVGCVAAGALLLRPLGPLVDPTRHAPVLPLFFFACVLLPVAGTWIARRRATRPWPCAALALAGALAVGGRGDAGTGFSRARDPEELTATMRSLPPGSIAAAPPHQVDAELLSGRRPYLWEDAALPFHVGYAEEIRRRERQLVAATYAPVEAGWDALLALRADGVTHLVVDREGYVQPHVGAPAPFERWWNDARRSGGPWLAQLAWRGRIPLLTRNHASYSVLDLGNVDGTRWLRDFAHPQAPATLDAWLLRREALRQTLLGLAGLPLPGVPGGRTLASRTVDGVIIEDLLVDGWNGLSIPITLYLPEARTGPVPAVCLFSGHDRAARNAPYIRTMAWTLAKSGIAALTLDWMGMGTRWTDDISRHVPMGARLVAAGIPPVRPMVGEPMRVLDYLAARPEIDPERIAVAGQSGGGFVAMHLAALSPRVAAAVVVDIVVTNDYIRDGGWGDPDSFFPWSLRLTDHGEILGLVAPRPLLVLSGDSDPVAPTEVGSEALVTTRAIYGLYGAGARLTHESTPESHSWSQAKIGHTLSFLGETLIGAPITTTTSPPAGTEPLGAPPPGEPPWWTEPIARLATSPPPPADLPAWADATRARLRAHVVPAAEPALPDPPRAPLTVLWLSEDALPPALIGVLADRLVVVAPPGLGLVAGWNAHNRLHLWQDAVARGGSLLGVAVSRVVAEARAARRAGARTVVALCWGRQAAILCATAAALEHPFDVMALGMYPPDFREIFFFREQPDLYFATPGLMSAASPEAILALAAPTRIFLLDIDPAGWPLARAAHERLGGSIEFVTDMVTLVARLRAGHAAQSRISP